MKHILSEYYDYSFPADPHTVAETDDFSPLDRVYSGRKAYFGDYHVHSASGGTSDGKTTPEDWLKAMKELQIDFVGLMDHRQVRHMYLDAFDPEYFLYGTEPGTLVHIEDRIINCHYLMIFKEPGKLEELLERFPEFEFTGGTEGHFVYPHFEKARFVELVRTVLELGGAFVHPHPKQLPGSDIPEDYYFTEGVAMETIYSCGKIVVQETADNYKHWMDLLALGKKIYNTATADVHGTPNTEGLNVVYAPEKTCAAYVEQLRKGDLNAGYIGIKMSIDETPMGATAPYREGQTLFLKIEDVHPLCYDPQESYLVNIITDQGLAYSAPFTLSLQVALKVEPRLFYRVEVIRQSDGFPAAIGNPIWLK